jgi:predicted nucleotidyltransferase
MTPRVPIPAAAIADFCRRWKVTEFALFGSVLRDDFGPDSDVDVLVSFSPEARHTLFDLVRMEDELREAFGRRVDLVTRRAVERSTNAWRRDAILGSLAHVGHAS